MVGDGPRMVSEKGRGPGGGFGGRGRKTSTRVRVVAGVRDEDSPVVCDKRDVRVIRKGSRGESKVLEGNWESPAG